MPHRDISMASILIGKQSLTTGNKVRVVLMGTDLAYGENELLQWKGILEGYFMLYINSPSITSRDLYTAKTAGKTWESSPNNWKIFGNLPEETLWHTETWLPWPRYP